MFEQEMLDKIERSIHQLENICDFLCEMHGDTELPKFLSTTYLAWITSSVDSLVDNLKFVKDKYNKFKSE